MVSISTKLHSIGLLLNINDSLTIFAKQNQREIERGFKELRRQLNKT